MNKEKKGGFCVSMKLELVLLFIIFGMLPMIIATGVQASYILDKVVENQAESVGYSGMLLADRVSENEYFDGETAGDRLDGLVRTYASLQNARVMVIKTDYSVAYDSFGTLAGSYMLDDEVTSCMTQADAGSTRRYDGYYTVTRPIEAGDGGIKGVLFISVENENLSVLRFDINRYTAMIYIVALAFLAAAAMAAAIILLHPVDRLNSKLRRVAEGDLNVDIRTTACREARDISDSVYETINRLQEADRSRQEFVSNVSHELKTPITSMRVLADSLLSMGDVPADMYREFMTDISAEIDREARIINDLLSLARMDRENAVLNIAPVDIDQLTEQILKRVRPIAGTRDVEMIYERKREVTAEVDEVKLSLAITNLAENAVKYNKPGGSVHVVLDADHQNFYIEVTDTGVGIPDEEQSRIFERFYRVDKARSRDTGGSGLGLAIVKSVVMMHGGALKVASKFGEGSTFTMRVPIKHIEKTAAGKEQNS